MANGNTPVYSGFGNVGVSPASKAYLETIRGAGERLSGAATGFLKAKAEIQRREAEARSIIPEANFSEDQGTKSLFAADALEIENKINGFGTDSYDFSRLDDIARFNKDIASLTKELSEAETVYNETIANFKQLELDNDLFKKVGEDPNQAIATEIAGIGDVYNAKAGRESYDLTIGEAAVLRNGRFEKTADGKYILKDSQGNEIKTYNSKQEYFKDLAELSKPDMRPVPVLAGLAKVEKENWDKAFKEESKAESAFVNYVLNNPEVTRRRAQERSNSLGSEFIPVESPEGDALMARHPRSSAGFDSMTQDQYEYVQELLQGWRDMQPKEEVDTTSVTGGYVTSEGKKPEHVSELGDAVPFEPSKDTPKSLVLLTDQGRIDVEGPTPMPSSGYTYPLRQLRNEKVSIPNPDYESYPDDDEPQKIIEPYGPETLMDLSLDELTWLSDGSVIVSKASDKEGRRLSAIYLDSETNRIQINKILQAMREAYDIPNLTATELGSGEALRLVKFGGQPKQGSVYDSL